MSKVKSTKRKTNYIKRNIIKLGSSYAITFPTNFLKSFAEDKNVKSINKDEDILKGNDVHCYKVDPNSIIIKKTEAESEIQILDINISKFPMDLLESLLNCARKLNINQVKINYQEKDYEKCLGIINKIGVPPVHSENIMMLDLSRTYLQYNFPNQIKGMVKNFSKIIDLSTDNNIKKNEEIESKKETYLTSIYSSYNEAIRVLIMRLNNYYLQSQDAEEGGITNIINTLGNRVLVSKIINISDTASNLSLYRGTEELKKFIPVIKELPILLKEEIDLILDLEIADKIEEINGFNSKLILIKEEFGNTNGGSSEKISVIEAIISNIIGIILDTLFAIQDIIITRWIESKTEVE